MIYCFFTFYPKNFFVLCTHIIQLWNICELVIASSSFWVRLSSYDILSCDIASSSFRVRLSSYDFASSSFRVMTFRVGLDEFNFRVGHFEIVISSLSFEFLHFENSVNLFRCSKNIATCVSSGQKSSHKKFFPKIL